MPTPKSDDGGAANLAGVLYRPVQKTVEQLQSALSGDPNRENSPRNAEAKLERLHKHATIDEPEVVTAPARPQPRPTAIAAAAEEFVALASLVSKHISDFESNLNRYKAHVEAEVYGPVIREEGTPRSLVLSWKRERTGAWRIFREIWSYTPDEPLPETLISSKPLGDCTLDQRIEAADTLAQLVPQITTRIQSRTEHLRNALLAFEKANKMLGGA